MRTRRGEFLAAYEPTVDTESVFDAMVVEDNQSDGRFPDPAGADESDWCQVFCQANDLVDQFVTSETSPRRRWRRFTRYARCKFKILDPSVVEFTDLV